jgi:hypothetical protein
LSPAAARSPSDVDVLAGTVFVLAAALATNPLLHTFASDDATTLISRLAPPATIDRLWVVFILIPAVVTFVGIGVPYAFRVLVTLLRRRLATEELRTAIALAVCAVLVLADLTMARSGIVPLALTCVVTAWRAGAAFVLRGERIAAPFIATAGAALLGVAFYQRELHAGNPPSVAIAPTLVLVAFYTGLAGAAGGLLAATARRASVWLGSIAALIGAAWWIGLRALPLVRSGSETAEMLLTTAAGGALISLALVAKRSSS